MVELCGLLARMDRKSVLRNSMNLDELLKLVSSGEGPSIRVDSREVAEGDIFVAVKGTASDGHDFIAQAVANGARYVVSQQNTTYDIRNTTYESIDVEDTALISLYTKQGVPIQIRMDYWRNPPAKKMHVVGEKGEIFWDYYGKELTLSQNNSRLKKFCLADNWDRNDMFIAIMKNFFNAISKSETIRVPLIDGIEVLKIALAAKQSSLKNEVIDL